MHQNGENTRVAGNVDGSEHRVPQERTAKAPVVVAAVDRQAAQQKYWQRIRHVAPQSSIDTSFFALTFHSLHDRPNPLRLMRYFRVRYGRNRPNLLITPR